MDATFECLPCLLKQAPNTARVLTADPAVQGRIVRRVAEAVPTLRAKLGDTFFMRGRP